MSKIGLIIEREYLSRVKKKGFIVLTFLIPVLVVGLAVLVKMLDEDKKDVVKVLVSDQRDLCEGKIWIGPGENPPATFYFTQQVFTGEEFRDGKEYQDYDVLLTVDPDVITNRTLRAVYRDEPSGRTQRYITGKIDARLKEYAATQQGMTLDEWRLFNQPYDCNFLSLESMDPDAENKDVIEKAQSMGMMLSVLIFVFIIIYSGLVLRGVLEEKTSRVVEIIVSSVKPFQLMLGKVVAVGLVGLTQFVIWIVLIVVALTFLKDYLLAGGMDSENVAAMQEMMMQNMGPRELSESEEWLQAFQIVNWPLLLTLFVIYFIGGYLLYGSIFAMVGSASDSEADTQQLIIPVIIPLMFIYFLSFTIIGHVDSGRAIWGSFIPFSSPIIMLQRIAAGSVAFWEWILSLLLLAGTFVLTTWMAGKIYRTGILMYGKKASWKEIIKWLKH